MPKATERPKADTPNTSNTGVFRSLGVDYMTWSKVGVVKGFRDQLDEIRRTFKSVGESRGFGKGYYGVDLAVNGCLAWRGSCILADFKGSAMQVLRHNLGFTDEQSVRWFLDRGFKATRLDICLDTSDRRLNPLRAYRAYQNGLVRCEASYWDWDCDPKWRRQREIFPKDGKGMTTYIGSRKSERYIRMYDKLTESLSKHGEIPMDEAGNELDHLTRIEFQNRRKVAHSVVLSLDKRGLRVIPEIVAGYVTFLSARDSRARRRKREASWWTDIVGSDRSYVNQLHEVSSPERSIHWIKSQVVPTLKLMQRHTPDEFKKLMEDSLLEYEPRPLPDATWQAFAERKAKRKAELAEMRQSERDDFVIADFQKYRKKFLEENGYMDRESEETTGVKPLPQGEPYQRYGYEMGVDEDGAPIVLAVVDWDTGELLYEKSGEDLEKGEVKHV